MTNLNRVTLRDERILTSSSILSNNSPNKPSNVEAGAKILASQKAILYAKDFLSGGIASAKSDDIGFADFLEGQAIEEIDLSQFSGRMNSRILIHFSAATRINEVKVQIFNQDGSLSESGQAKQELFHTQWVYTLAVDAKQHWLKITVEAKGD